MSAPQPPALTPVEVNHLRRLVAWVACESGQSPEEMVPMVQGIVRKLGGVSDEGKGRLVEGYERAAAVPKYIRAAVKALRKTIAARPDGIDDAEIVEPAAVMLPGATRALPAPDSDTEGGSHD